MKSIVFTLLFMVLSFAYHSQMILKYNTSLSPGTTIPLGLYGDFTEGIFLNVNVDWGDGNSDSYNFGDLYYHTFAQEGIYTVTISGDLGRMTSHSDKLIEVESFGNLGITSLNNSFINAANLVAVPNTLPSTVKNLSYCLSGANSFNQDVSSWNVENVTRFSGMFMGASNFNQPLGTWNMSSATEINHMFENAVSFDQDLSTWDVSQVLSAEGFLRGTALSTTNTDNLLIAWAAQSVQNNVVIDFGGATYSAGAATNAREMLENDYDWEIAFNSDYAHLFMGGKGIAGDPFLIATPTHLNNIRHAAHLHFELANDIDLDVYPYNEAPGWSPIDYFDGTLDGNNYVIHDLYIDSDSINSAGFIDWFNGVIKNVTFKNVLIYADEAWGVGGVAVSAGGFDIINVSLTGEIVAPNAMVGGIIAETYGGGDEFINGCQVEVTILGNTVGGIVGTLHYGNIINCGAEVNLTGESAGGVVAVIAGGSINRSYSKGTVHGVERVGGIIGAYYWDDIDVMDNYTECAVTGENWVGGIIGLMAAPNTMIKRCYATGKVEGDTLYGPLYGEMDYPQNITDSYWNVNAYGLTTSVDSTGKTTADMQQEATFTGWDFGNIWFIDEGNDFPRFQWEETLIGDLAVTEHNLTVNNVIVYPNPTSNMLTVQLDEHIKQIVICDQNGRLVLQQENPMNNQVHVDYLENGLYFMQVVSLENVVYQSKFIKN